MTTNPRSLNQGFPQLFAGLDERMRRMERHDHGDTGTAATSGDSTGTTTGIPGPAGPAGAPGPPGPPGSGGTVAVREKTTLRGNASELRFFGTGTVTLSSGVATITTFDANPGSGIFMGTTQAYLEGGPNSDDGRIFVYSTPQSLGEMVAIYATPTTGGTVRVSGSGFHISNAGLTANSPINLLATAKSAILSQTYATPFPASAPVPKPMCTAIDVDGGAHVGIVTIQETTRAGFKYNVYNLSTGTANFSVYYVPFTG